VIQKSLVKVYRASLKYLTAFIDLNDVTLLVIQAPEMNFYWDPNEQSTKRHPVNIRFQKILVQHIGEIQSC